MKRSIICSAVTLMSFGLWGSQASAGTFTQYGLFPAGASGGAIVTTAGPSQYACNGVATGSSNWDGLGTATGAACTALQSSPNTPGDNSASMIQSFTFQQFNPSWGTLTAIKFQVYNDTIVTASGSSGSSALTYNVNTEISMATSNSVSLSTGKLNSGVFYDDKISAAGSGANPSAYNSYDLAANSAFGPIMDYTSDDPTSTFARRLAGAANSNTFTAASITSTNLTTAFTGTGTTNLYWQILGTQTETGSSQGSITFNTWAGTEIVLEYDYTTPPPVDAGVPEPTSLLLLGSGLALVARKLRQQAA